MGTYPVVIKHGLLGNPAFIGGFPTETSMLEGFPMAMFDYWRMVIRKWMEMVYRPKRTCS